MNAITSERVYMRSLATRDAKGELSSAIDAAVGVVQSAGFDLVLIETSGIGQGDADIVDHCQVPIYVMTAEFGAHSQLEKIDMLDFAKFVVLNKFEKGGSQDAIRAVRKQFRRNRGIGYDVEDESLPVFGTIASQFNDTGVNAFFTAVMDELGWAKEDTHFKSSSTVSSKTHTIIPGDRSRYLADIAGTCRGYRKEAERQADLATALYQLDGVAKLVGTSDSIEEKRTEVERQLSTESRSLIEEWPALVKAYSEDMYIQKALFCLLMTLKTLPILEPELDLLIPPTILLEELELELEDDLPILLEELELDLAILLLLDPPPIIHLCSALALQCHQVRP